MSFPTILCRNFTSLHNFYIVYNDLINKNVQANENVNTDFCHELLRRDYVVENKPELSKINPNLKYP